LRPLAKQGNANAQIALGMMHQRGHGVTQSFAEAVRWYRKAAKGGYVRAYNNLGAMYEAGLGGLTRDYAAALRLCSKFHL
jgi:TPR repeat protein